MQNNEIEKGKTYRLIDIIDYVPNSSVTKIIFKKATGNISLMSIDVGVTLDEKISPYDTYMEIIEGAAEILIHNESKMLQSGDAIIVPAHAPSLVKAHERIKLVYTIIKSGYEGIIL